jgi:hypothetical protein
MAFTNRRDFLITAAGISTLGITSCLKAAPPSLATSGAMPTPKLALTELLMYSTVRLSNQNGQELVWGTGFFFELFHTASTSVPVIVTDRHVVEELGGACSFSFVSALPNRGPDYYHQIPIQIPNFPTRWIPHPHVDLAIIPIGPILAQLEQSGHPVYWVYLEPSQIPTDDELNQLTPVEQILTVGYPGQLWDQAHNLPVFHRGYTATAPYINFNRREEFLIDIATWPGASGSPVMLYEENGWTDRNGNTFLGRGRMSLLGVVYAVAEQDVQGNLILQNGPTRVVAPTSLQLPTNLGACTRSSRILEFEPLLVQKGLVSLPAGYVMRAG